MVVGETPAISLIEFFVTPFDDLIWNDPEKSVVSELFPGKVVGFEIKVWDFEPDPGFFALAGESTSSTNASYFVDGILVGLGNTLPDVSSVGSVTWGRIKASFR